MDSLDELLESCRERSLSERGKGGTFEDIVRIYLKRDKLQSSEYGEVWQYRDWSEERREDGRDIGIDLVARLRNEEGEEGYVAIQCKFYGRDSRIDKTDLDSFMAASGRSPFVRRLFFDTTEGEWTDNALRMLDNQHIPLTRIGLRELRGSSIDWSRLLSGEVGDGEQKRLELRGDQKEALEKVLSGLEKSDRGKMIMACGTGKTLTSLRIAERKVGEGGKVLLMVPSLALMSQTVREWANHSDLELSLLSVCSDGQVGHRKVGDSDSIDIGSSDLEVPPTTDASKLATSVSMRSSGDRMMVVCATYHSIDVVSKAQKEHGMGAFDLIICDEAHRTTGVKFEGEGESNFVKVHDNANVEGVKRLYMTATPRIYSNSAKNKASELEATLSSMDDEEKFGKTLYFMGFAEAVNRGLLSDYKVSILVVPDGVVSGLVVDSFTEDSALKLDDASKIVGCYKALSKQFYRGDSQEGGEIEEQRGNSAPMKRAVAFCRSIKTSKTIKKSFMNVVSEYTSKLGGGERGSVLDCKIEHVDGTMKAKERGKYLDWLGREEEGSCHILSNAKCLTEGVDVPSLDAVMFMNPRRSQIEVVQAVGRVMRKAEGKELGYVILPVALPSKSDEDEKLREGSYQVVWQVLNALRSHDESLDAKINQMALGEDVSDKIEIVGAIDQVQMDAVTAVIDNLPNRDKQSVIGEPEVEQEEEEGQLYLALDEIRAKLVDKCGTLDYWDNWAKDVAKIAKSTTLRLEGMIEKEEVKEYFESFHKELQGDLNNTVTRDDAIELLAQHAITKPVFNDLFGGDDFVKENPVSKAMEMMLEIMRIHNVDSESTSLTKFYGAFRRQMTGIKTLEGKQALIVKLYDKFFKNAFPRVQEKLGIVYTPVEVVDFIIHSVNDILRDEFGKTLGSQGVHIIDPFIGTGTFVTRLMQSGLIKPEELEHKYKNEIHTNELVLLAYYIAGINIETVYHDIMQKQGIEQDYTPFEGICLTDTFEMYESNPPLVSQWMPENSERRKRQRASKIEVIIGNPPYSAGQRSQNDNNANVKYDDLDEKIRNTYAKHSKANSQKGLYDSYIRAIRWASDRLEDTGSGIVAFITNSAWLERSFADGMRKCLAEEFSSIYAFHLRGDIRKNILSGGMAGEGENIFGNATMTGACIVILVKNPDAEKQGQIFFHDIGKELKRDVKMKKIIDFASLIGITNKGQWQSIIPDEHHDWLNQRDPSFANFIKMGDKKDKTNHHLFANYSLGIVTSRDSWCYNASKNNLSHNMQGMIDTYNQERIKYYNLPPDQRPQQIQSFVTNNPKKISWSSSLIQKLQKNVEGVFSDKALTLSSYRPFHKQYLYYDRMFNDRTGQMPKIFPMGTDLPNRVIAVSGVGSQRGFSCLMTDHLPDYQMIQNGQNFSLYIYEKANPLDKLSGDDLDYKRMEGITNEGMLYFQESYPDETVIKEDIFYYIYGLLHSTDYRERFANNLLNELPRIPCVKTAKDFWAYSQAGRDLANLHLNYEEIEPYDVTTKDGKLFEENERESFNPEEFYRVKQMKFGKNKKKQTDKRTIIYNEHITITDVPLEAYDYAVNGKSAIEWVMNRQGVRKDKDSGIVSDANDYANETVGNPAYPFELLCRIITVSLETMKIVDTLPPLDID